VPCSRTPAAICCRQGTDYAAIWWFEFMPAIADGRIEKYKMDEKSDLNSAETSPGDAAIVRRDLALLITKALNLDLPPESIDIYAPLYGAGLGLDSIDILEIALVISKEYGIRLRADSEENKIIFSSLNALSDFVARNRTR
jgi:acyl carrier protein